MNSLPIPALGSSTAWEDNTHDVVIEPELRKNAEGGGEALLEVSSLAFEVVELGRRL